VCGPEVKKEKTARKKEKRRGKERERVLRQLERTISAVGSRRGMKVQGIMVVIVCSTTLWVGHLSKLVQQEELSDTFGEYGDIISIDLIPPRGCAFICMNRRQDAYKALNKLKNHKMQGKIITVLSIYK